MTPRYDTSKYKTRCPNCNDKIVVPSWKFCQKCSGAYYKNKKCVDCGTWVSNNSTRCRKHAGLEWRRLKRLKKNKERCEKKLQSI